MVDFFRMIALDRYELWDIFWLWRTPDICNVLVKQQVLYLHTQSTESLASGLDVESETDIGWGQQVNAIKYVAEEKSSRTVDPQDWIWEHWPDLLIGNLVWL